jgi:F-type H+-transporting ATPase subunit epsilon
VTLHVELVSPEQILYSGEADMVVCRTTDGEIAFLTGHAPFVGALGIAGVKIVEPGGRVEQAAVHGGFVEVSHDRVTILSDVAELASHIDLNRAAARDDRRRMRGHVAARPRAHPTGRDPLSGAPSARDP